MIKIILKLEGLAIFISSVYFFHLSDGTWMWFVVLFLAPDLSMIGYLKNKRVGAILYNLAHNFFTAFIMIAFALTINNEVILHLGIILLAHVGIDRFFGYGLKDQEDFKKTHMQKV